MEWNADLPHHGEDFVGPCRHCGDVEELNDDNLCAYCEDQAEENESLVCEGCGRTLNLNGETLCSMCAEAGPLS